MTFYFLFIPFLLFPISSFSSFCTDLYSSLSFFWNASFFLFMMPLILLVIQGSKFSVELYTLHRIQHNYPHTDSVCLLILIDESTKISQSVQSRDPLKFLNSISRPLFNSASNGRFPLHQRPISGDK